VVELVEMEQDCLMAAVAAAVRQELGAEQEEREFDRDCE
jgi:hypothetical protein